MKVQPMRPPSAPLYVHPSVRPSRERPQTAETHPDRLTAADPGANGSISTELINVGSVRLKACLEVIDGGSYGGCTACV